MDSLCLEAPPPPPFIIALFHFAVRNTWWPVLPGPGGGTWPGDDPATQGRDRPPGATSRQRGGGEAAPGSADSKKSGKVAWFGERVRRGG